MEGSERNPGNTLLYPHQDKPPPQAWRVWRECILATFLKRREENQPTLYKPIQLREQQANSHRRELLYPGMKLEGAVALLPGYIREAIGTIKYPIDNGRQISDDLRHSRTASWTDGTVKDSIGAHSYTIRVLKDNEDLCIRGAAGMPGDFTSMTCRYGQNILELWWWLSC